MKNKAWALMALTMITATGCQKSQESTPTADEEILRLDQVAYDYADMDSAERAEIRATLGGPLKAYMEVVNQDTAATADDVTLLAWSESTPVEMFVEATDTLYEDMSAYEKELGAMLAKSSELGLKIPRHTYAAVVWGRPESMILNVSVMLVALNHYLGAEHPAYEHWPEYMRQNKEPEALAYDIAEAEIGLAYPYNAPAEKNTVLSRMLYEGALAYAKTQVIKDAKAGLALGFTDRQMADLAENEAFMWKKLATGQMLYSTDAELHDRLFRPAPTTTAISPQAPGRAVRYTGLRIVESYVKANPDATLPFLLSPEFYANPQSLAKAKYQMRNEK